MKTIIRSKDGKDERTVSLDEIAIPDLWHLAIALQAEGRSRESADVLEVWHLAHDLLRHIYEKD